MTEKDICNLIEGDERMMEILRAVQELNLPDWWIGAGFVRSKVWDYLSGYDHNEFSDIDAIYFDESNLSEEIENDYQAELRRILPQYDWSVTNEARMYVYNEQNPYKSSEHVFSHWPETATCIAVKLDKDGKVIFSASWGIDDLVNMVVRRSPLFYKKDVYNERIKKKNWLKKWPKLKFIYEEI